MMMIIKILLNILIVMMKLVFLMKANCNLNTKYPKRLMEALVSRLKNNLLKNNSIHNEFIC